jgi:hypothetical protein
MDLPHRGSVGVRQLPAAINLQVVLGRVLSSDGNRASDAIATALVSHENVQSSRERLLASRRKLLASGKDLRKIRIEAGDAEAAFMSKVREHMLTGQPPEDLWTAYENVGNARDALGKAEDDYLIEESRLSASEWEHADVETELFQIHLQGAADHLVAFKRQIEDITATTQRTPLLPPPPPPPPPPPLTPPPTKTVLFHATVRDPGIPISVPPAPPPSQPPLPSAMTPRLKISTGHTVTPMVSNQCTGNDAPPRVVRSHFEVSDELKLLRAEFDRLRPRQAEHISGKEDVYCGSDAAQLEESTRPEFVEHYSDLLERIVKCENEVLELKKYASARTELHSPTARPALEGRVLQEKILAWIIGQTQECATQRKFHLRLLQGLKFEGLDADNWSESLANCWRRTYTEEESPNDGPDDEAPDIETHQGSENDSRDLYE